MNNKQDSDFQNNFQDEATRFGNAQPQRPSKVNRLGDSYILVKQLGRGGMGEVWLADEMKTDINDEERLLRKVVVKIIPPDIQCTKEEMERVSVTFGVIHGLQHEHICPVYAMEVDKRYGYFLVMKFVDGPNLSDFHHVYTKRHGQMPLKKLLKLLFPVADALDYAHRKGVVHRDIKSQNIMLDKKDGVQIIDFGLADQIRTSLSHVSQVQMGTSGTPYYMAPEQWDGTYQDAKTDQFAFAVMTYRLLTGRYPFPSSDKDVLRIQVRENDVPPIENYPESVHVFFSKAMAKKREDRYPTCRDFLIALKNAPEQSLSELTSPSATKSLLFIGVFILGFIIITLVFFANSQSLRQTKNAIPPQMADQHVEPDIPVLHVPEEPATPKPQSSAKPTVSFPYPPPPTPPEKSIFDAIKENDLETVKKWVDIDPKIVYTKLNDGCTPLHMAIKEKRYDAAKALLAAKADVNALDNVQWTPLHYAVMDALDEAVQLLIQAQADINVKSNAGWTPLHYASNRKAKTTVELLLKSGADPHVINQTGQIPRDMTTSPEIKELLHNAMAPKIALTDAIKNDDTTTIQAWIKHAQQGTSKALFDHARACDTGGKTEDAKKFYKLTFEADPNHASALNNYAVLLPSFKERLPYYKRAAEADQASSIFAYNYAACLMALDENNENHDEIEKYYKKAIELNPKYATALFEYADFLEKKKKDLNSAKPYYKRATEAKPHNEKYANKYKELSKPEITILDAIKNDDTATIQAWIKHAPQGTSKALFDHALFLDKQKIDYDGAEKYYKLTIESDSKNAKAHLNYAILLEVQKQNYARAEYHYKLAIELDPKNALLLFNYATFLEKKKKNPNSAQEYYKLATEAEPGNEEFANKYNCAAFDDVIKKGDIISAKKCIEYDPSVVNKRFAFQVTPLHLAASNNQLEIVRALILAKADVNVFDGVKLTPLHYAASKNNKEIVELLLKSGADPAVKSLLNKTPLDSTKSSVIKELISNAMGPKVPLAHAIKNDDTKTIQAWIKHAPKETSKALFDHARACDSDGKKEDAKKFYKLAFEADPNHASALNNYAVLLTDLKERLPYFKRAAEADQTSSIIAYNYASSLVVLDEDGKNHDEIEKYYKKSIELDSKYAIALYSYADFLENKKKDLSSAMPYYKRATEAEPDNETYANKYKELSKPKITIFEAIKKNDLEAVKKWIEIDPKIVHETDFIGRTPLHAAAAGFNISMIQLLVDNGADINANKGSIHMTPLYSAAGMNSNVEVLKYLVSRGSDINVKNFFDMTALHSAARGNSNVEVLKYLVSQGLDINAKDNRGETLLHCAARGNSNIEVLKYLVSQGLDINVKDNHGWTPLHCAVESNPNIEVLKYLIEKGADVNAETDDGKTSFDFAIVTKNELRDMPEEGEDANASIDEFEKKTRILREAMINTPTGFRRFYPHPHLSEPDPIEEIVINAPKIILADAIKNDDSAAVRAWIKQEPQNSSKFIAFTISTLFKVEMDEVKKHLKLAIAADPKDSIAHVLYAFCIQYQDIEGAEKHLKLAIEANPKCGMAHALYAEFIAEQKQDYEGAEKHLKLAIEVDPKDTYAFILYAEFLCDQKHDYESAEKYLTFAASLNFDSWSLPLIASSYDKIAKQFVAIEKDTEALNALNKAIELEPDNGKYYYHRSIAHLLIENFLFAQNDLKRAEHLGYDPDDDFGRERPIIGSAATDIEVGDTIFTVNGKPVNTHAELTQAVEQSPEEMLLTMRPRGRGDNTILYAQVVLDSSKPRFGVRSSPAQNGGVRITSIVKRQGIFCEYLQEAKKPDSAGNQGNDQSSLNNIFEAAQKGSVRDITYFFEHGIYVDTKNNKGHTALHWAAEWNADLDVLKYLIAQGADIHARDSTGWTALHHAAYRNTNVEILKYLIEQGAVVNVKNDSGKIPFDIADTQEKKTILRNAMR